LDKVKVNEEENCRLPCLENLSQTGNGWIIEDIIETNGFSWSLTQLP